MSQWGNNAPQQGWGQQGWGQPQNQGWQQSQGWAGQGNAGRGWPAPQQPSPQQHWNQQNRTQQNWGQPGFGQQSPWQQQSTWQQLPAKKKSNTGTVVGLSAIGILAVALVVVILTRVAGTQYANDDYEPAPATNNPAPLPQPDPGDTMEELTQTNALYAQQIATPIRCESEPVRPTQTSDAELEAWANEYTECLMRAWNPAFEDTEYELVRPRVTVYSDTIETPCNSGSPIGPSAFYCPANQEIYWSTGITEDVPAVDEPFAIDMVLAHEYAHNVQARALIGEAWREEAVSATQEEALLLSRRSETQADCMAGMTVSAMAESRDISVEEFNNIMLATQAVGSDAQTGDPSTSTTHPQAAIRDYWMRQGLNSADVSTCNTWTAPADQVR